MYFSDKDKELIAAYVRAATKKEKDRIYTQLYNTFEQLIIDSSASLNFRYDIRKDEELFQFIRVWMYDVLLPKIREEFIEAAQGFLFVSIQNKIKERLNNRNAKYRLVQIAYTKEDSMLTPEQIVTPVHYDKEPVEITRMEIRKALDDKIRAAKDRNDRKSMLTLLLIKQYLIDHHYDERGCGVYLQKMLRVKRNTVQNILYKNNIKSFILMKKHKEK